MAKREHSGKAVSTGADRDALASLARDLVQLDPASAEALAKKAAELKAGDRILFGKWNGTTVKTDGEDLLLTDPTSDKIGAGIQEQAEHALAEAIEIEARLAAGLTDILSRLDAEILSRSNDISKLEAARAHLSELLSGGNNRKNFEKIADLLSPVVNRGVSSEEKLKEYLIEEFKFNAEAANDALPSIKLAIRDALARAASGADAAPAGEKLELPKEPPKYAYKPRMPGGIVQYLRDNWAEYIEAGVLSRPDLKDIDKPAYVALNNWLRQEGNELPADLYVPTKSEAIDRIAGAAGSSDDLLKIASALQSRARRDRSPEY